ncbi:MAG: rRNA maturation RNase YbeY [Rhodospirillales bacterium]
MATATTIADRLSAGGEAATGAAADIEVDITVACSGWEHALPDLHGTCRAAVLAALAAVQTNTARAEISLVLADDAFVRDLNRRYRDIDRPTNVLAFCGDEADADADDDAGDDAGAGRTGPPRLLGDVIVAHETARAEAQAENKSLAAHLCHLIVHGVLHLLGHDHQNDEEAETMEALEVEALAAMGIDNPYAEST